MNDLKIDVLFGLVESMGVMVSSLIAHHPDREGLEAHMDFRIEKARTTIINGDRSDLALEAFDSLTAAFKHLIEEPYHDTEQARHLVEALRKRLTGE